MSHLEHSLKTQQHSGVTWVDVTNPSSEILSKLEKEYQLHPIHLHESVQKVQHIQVEREDEYLFLVLHVPEFDAQADKVKVNQVGIFLGKDFLVTIQAGRSPVITDTFNYCETNSQEADNMFSQGAAYVLYTVISNVLSDISAMTEAVESELDAIEDQVFDNNASDAQRIGKVRQKIVRISRAIGPKKLILKDLSDQIDDFSDKNMTRLYANNTKTVNKLWEVIEEAKETVEIYKDADFTTSTEQTNEILAVLTLLFTFTIPITVVGTLYGMNIPLPGGNETGPWTFMGQYTTFGILLIISIGSAAAMYLYFKRKNWF